MKLKDRTFAIIAEKQDSISHRWFKENPNTYWPNTYWYWNSGCYYQYDKGEITYFNPKANEYPDKDIPIYTESEFEALLKAEQENEAKEITQELMEKYNMQGGLKGVYMASPEQFTKLTPKENYQVIFAYQTAIDLLAYYTKIDKGIIKIEMP